MTSQLWLKLWGHLKKCCLLSRVHLLQLRGRVQQQHRSQVRRRLGPEQQNSERCSPTSLTLRVSMSLTLSEQMLQPVIYQYAFSTTPSHAAWTLSDPTDLESVVLEEHPKQASHTPAAVQQAWEQQAQLPAWVRNIGHHEQNWWFTPNEIFSVIKSCIVKLYIKVLLISFS